MPVDQGSEIHNFTKWAAGGIISFAFGFMSVMSFRILNAIKKNQETLFSIAHENKEDIVRLETLISERTGNKKGD